MKFVDEALEAYCISKSNKPSEIANKLEKHTRENVDMSQMLVGKMEASFLGFLLRSIGAKKVLEFGTYTGYSALAMAENLPTGAEVHTIDINEETVAIAKEFWSQSEHGQKIVSHLGPGVEVLKKLKDEKFDLVFIDADKVNYLNYLKSSLNLLSDNGVIVVDNTLWSGKVLEDNQDESTEAIKEMNDFVASNQDLYGTLLPVRDGMFLIRKLS